MSHPDSPDSPAPGTLPPDTVALLGVPFDANSSFLAGPALAPDRIREALHSPSSNLCNENGRDLGQESRLRDVGDVALGEDPFQDIRDTVGGWLDAGARLLCLGGDHSVAFPILEAYGARRSGLTVLQLDAHPDLYDELDGHRYSHACPFARVMESGIVDRLVQVGIRTMNPHQRSQAERFGVEVVEMRQWRSDLDPVKDLGLTTPLYLSLDLDVLDPAFAPGVSHFEPGGLSTREVIDFLARLPRPLVGADLVELNPLRDPSGVTAMVAAKLLKEMVELLLPEDG